MNLSPLLHKLILLTIFFGSIFSTLYSQGWERVYAQFPQDGECAFGVEPTSDGGYLILGARGFDTQSAQVTYLMKTDAEGQVLWTRDVAPGGAVKFAKLTAGNFAILSRTPHPTYDYTYHYTVCQPDGTLILTDTIGSDSVVGLKATSITPITSGLTTGGFAIAAHGMLPGYRAVFIRTYNEVGQPINVFPLYEAPPSDSITIRSLIQTADGAYHCVGYKPHPGQDDADGVWFKMESNGHIDPSWIKVLDDQTQFVDPSDVFHDIAQTNDGNCWVLNLRNAYLGPDHDTLLIRKQDGNGNLIFNRMVATHISNVDFAGLDRSKIVALPDGGAAILFETYNPATVGEDFSLARINSNGDLLWTRHFGREKRFAESPFDMALLPDGGFALVGWFNDVTFHSNNAYIVRTDAQGLIHSNYIEGEVYADLNGNCQRDTNEPPLGGWMVRLEKAGSPVFNTLTDTDGRYALPTDSGTVLVRIIPAANYWKPCVDSVSITFSQPFDSTLANFGVKPLLVCPQLEVDIAAPFLRRCFSSYYTVTYSNRGTTNVPNAKVKVLLDDRLTFQSSDAAWTWGGGNEFSFNVGQLDIGEVGHFSIKVKVDCDAAPGAAHCTQATITPEDVCSPGTNWSGASIAVDGKCNINLIDFKVKNVGSGNITNSVDFVIIEDHVVIRAGHINTLPSGGDTTISVPANGATYRIETSQEPGHPGTDQPSVAVEGCGLNPDGNISTGYVTIFPENDGDPYISIDCQQNIGSFDPNDKQGYPKGDGDEHYIYPNTDLEYLIRFQNTGTDTAFTVVVKDTLDAWLDVNTVRPGPSDHAYKMEVLGENVLKFTFNDIMLPDSNINEAASHGFFKYTVKHRPNIPLGTVIQNDAAIFFDFNAPVITNTTWHTVDTGFLDRVIINVVNMPHQALASLNVSPNPIQSQALIELANGATVLNQWPDMRLRICNSTGICVREVDFSKGKTVFECQNLPNGMYFLELWGKGGVVAAGKMMVCL